MSRVLAIDPGLTTGIAWHDQTGHHTMNIRDETGKALWNFVKQWAWDHVILENYASRVANPNGDQTLRILGGVIGICTVNSIPLTIEWPNERTWKMVAAKAMLKVEGMPTPTDHQIDALAHLLNWEARNP